MFHYKMHCVKRLVTTFLKHESFDVMCKKWQSFVYAVCLKSKTFVKELVTTILKHESFDVIRKKWQSFVYAICLKSKTSVKFSSDNRPCHQQM